MVLNLVQFGCFIVFGLLTNSIGQIFVGEKGSDISIVIEFSYYPFSCGEIAITFESILQFENVFTLTRVMSFSDDGVQCLNNISPEYEARIFNASINFPHTVTFSLRNVSSQDSGWYVVWHLNEQLGKGILLLIDNVVRTCTSKQVKLDFILSLSALNERLAVMFYYSNPINISTITVCNPKSWTCSPPKSNLECRINGSGIFITLNSVQMADQGVYEVVGSRSLIRYPSAVLTVTECIPSPPASDMPLKTIEQPNATTQETHVVNTGISYSHAITTSAVYVTDQSFPIQKEYVVGGAVVVGFVIVTLTILFLCKRCRERRGTGEGVDQYDIPDVHYYSPIRRQDQCTPQSH